MTFAQVSIPALPVTGAGNGQQQSASLIETPPDPRDREVWWAYAIDVYPVLFVGVM